MALIGWSILKLWRRSRNRKNLHTQDSGGGGVMDCPRAGDIDVFSAPCYRPGPSMSLEGIVNFLIKNYSTLWEAPAVFFLLVIFSFGLAAFTVTMLYKSTVETLQQRLGSKDDLLEEYRQRLHLVPTDHTKFNRLSNQELRATTLAFVAEIRAFLHKYEDENLERSNRELRETIANKGKSEAELTRIWYANQEASSKVSAKYQQTYTDQFMTKALILRDELLTRLPTSRNKKVDNFYEHPLYYWASIEVSKDLERLALLLSS